MNFIQESSYPLASGITKFDQSASTLRYKKKSINAQAEFEKTPIKKIMQLYAFDKEGRLLSCKQAAKKHNYVCRECKRTVRLRSGAQRQSHFYHLQPAPSCRQNGKSLPHLQAQLFLQNLLPGGECKLEHRFEKIGRIADAAWLSAKIVFEIQCSPISPQEIAARQKDYGSEGFTVVWILHERRFNQTKESQAEAFLSKFPHYYTDIDEKGSGSIYDQFSYIKKGKRLKTIGKVPINPAAPFPLEKKAKPAPKPLESRMNFWPLGFQGDFLSGLYQPGTPGMQQLLHEALLWEKRANSTSISVLEFAGKLFYYGLARPYQLLFQIFLERACK